MNNIVTHFKAMSNEVGIHFPEILTLLKLLMVSPASSCDAERYFSALRRLMTSLRKERRLNAIMICNIHKEKLEELDIDDILKSFINNSFERRSIKCGK